VGRAILHWPRAAESSFAHHGDRDRSLARFNVALDVKNLLPGAQHELAVHNWNCQRRPQHRGLQVGMAVAVVPGLFMAVLPARRHELVQDSRQVFQESGFKFDRADGGGAADIENVCDAVAHLGGADNLGDLTGEVVHFSVPAGLNFDFSLIDHTAC